MFHISYIHATWTLLCLVSVMCAFHSFIHVNRIAFMFFFSLNVNSVKEKTERNEITFSHRKRMSCCFFSLSFCFTLSLYIRFKGCKRRLTLTLSKQQAKMELIFFVTRSTKKKRYQTLSKHLMFFWNSNMSWTRLRCPSILLLCSFIFSAYPNSINLARIFRYSILFSHSP